VESFFASLLCVNADFGGILRNVCRRIIIARGLHATLDVDWQKILFVAGIIAQETL
jgi:hypothetical protein